MEKSIFFSQIFWLDTWWDVLVAISPIFDLKSSSLNELNFKITNCLARLKTEIVRLAIVRLRIVRLPIVKLPIVRLPIVKLPNVRLPIVRLRIVRLPMYADPASTLKIHCNTKITNLHFFKYCIENKWKLF